MPFGRFSDIQSSLVLLLVLAGMFLWLLTYYFIIRKGFDDHSYGIPFAAVCLNFSSEYYLGFVCCPECPGSNIGYCKGAVGVDLAILRAWFLLDVVVLYQVFRFGQKYQPHRALQANFPLVVAFGLVLAYQGRITFIPSVKDFNGQLDAWMINFVMSVLFVLMALARSPSFRRIGADMSDATTVNGRRVVGVRGLSYPAAWTRTVANVCIALGLVLSGTLHATGREAFYQYLFVGCFVFDLTYIHLLRTKQ